MNIGVSFVAPLRRMGMDLAAFAQACLPQSAGTSGPVLFTSRRRKREEQRLSAQDQALRNLHALSRRKTALMVEQETLIAEIAEARRQHKPVSSTEAELRAVVTELLSIG